MTHFQVSLFHILTDSTPFATLQISAKMPLGALVFAMQQAQVRKADRVVVKDGEEQTAFYNVQIQGGSITYERAVLVIEEEGEDQMSQESYAQRRDERFFAATKTALQDIYERLSKLPLEDRYAGAYGVLKGYLESLLVNFAEYLRRSSLQKSELCLTSWNTSQEKIPIWTRQRG